jgi:hypothetical protein
LYLLSQPNGGAQRRLTSTAARTKLVFKNATIQPVGWRALLGRLRTVALVFYRIKKRYTVDL